MSEVLRIVADKRFTDFEGFAKEVVEVVGGLENSEPGNELTSLMNVAPYWFNQASKKRILESGKNLVDMIVEPDEKLVENGLKPRDIELINKAVCVVMFTLSSDIDPDPAFR